VQTPQFLNNVMQVFPGMKPRILIVGSPVYSDSARKYDMSEGWLSDGFLNASGAESIFSIAGKGQQLNGAKVYYCYLSDDHFDATNDRDAHKSKIQSFWGKYIGGMGGKLVAFLPNLKEVFPLWREGADGDVQHEAVDTNDKSMTIIKPAPPHTATVWDKQPTVRLPSDLLFSSGSSELKPSAAASLQELANSMRVDKSLHFRIDGYTDSHGGTEYNQRLSLQRADAVKAWLVHNGGVDATAIQTAGCGKSNPVAPPGSTASEAPNRRVEITVEGVNTC
jgi:outer membrane protein OmpA-like peptidoglycan-associated protein